MSIHEPTIIDGMNKAAAQAALEIAGGIQTEVNSIETAAGLETDGTLASFSGTNYLDLITSLRAAIIEADSKIKSESIKYSIALGD